MSTAELDFRRLNYKSPETFDRKWFEWFREEFSRRVFGVDMAPEPDVPFSLEGTVRLLPELAIYTGACTPMRSQSTQDFIAKGTVGITVALAGDMAISIPGEAIALEPGMAMFGTGEVPVVLDVHSNARVMVITLSRRLLSALVPAGSLATRPIPLESQAMRLLRAYLSMLDAEDAIESPGLRHFVSASVHELVALALGATRDARDVAGPRGVRAARLAAIKQDILANISDSRLSVTAVANRQGFTPRYIHMLFEGEGVSFTEFVIDLRLSRAHRLLIDPRFLHQSISAIALRVGFGDLSYFNRTFRRRFGVTPSDVREQARHESG